MAEPAGIQGCDTDCVNERESKWADLSKENVLANLSGFRALYTGTRNDEDDPKKDSAIGFYEFLIAHGEEKLADRMLGNIDSAISEVLELESSFYEALQKDEKALHPLYDAVKAVSDDLKGEFATVLSLKIPSEAAGDAD